MWAVPLLYFLPHLVPSKALVMRRNSEKRFKWNRAWAKARCLLLLRDWMVLTQLKRSCMILKTNIESCHSSLSVTVFWQTFSNISDSLISCQLKVVFWGCAAVNVSFVLWMLNILILKREIVILHVWTCLQSIILGNYFFYDSVTKHKIAY